IRPTPNGGCHIYHGRYGFLILKCSCALIPGDQPRHAKTVGHCSLADNAHDITASSAIVKEGLYGCGQVGIDRLTILAGNEQITTKYLVVLVDIFHRRWRIDWPPFGKTNEGSDIQPQRTLCLRR